MPTRDYLYHLWDDPLFTTSSLPDWSFIYKSVKKIKLRSATSAPGAEVKKFYSLKRDMAKLRSIGAAKSIVDASVIDLGKSTEGRELWALKVGKGTAHKVLFTGCHHAREWISCEVPYLVAEYLIENYTATPSTPNEKRINHLLNNREIWFVPMVNPDGHMWTFKNRKWRANRGITRYLTDTVLSPPTIAGCTPRTFTIPAMDYVGVDLNRNYATANWGVETYRDKASCTGITTNRDPRVTSLFCGKSANSEKESKLIADLIIAKKFRASITYHSFSKLLLYPEAAKHNDLVQNVGKGMDALIAEKASPKYDYKSGSDLYETSGDLMDFSYEKMPGRPTFTPELQPKGPVSWPPTVAEERTFFSGLGEDKIKPCFEENLAAALALINCAGQDAVPAAGTKQSCSFQWSFPIYQCQVVRNCWEVFKGWVP